MRGTARSGRGARGRRAERPGHYETVALVLQGGGALGAYQAGVYEGLHEAGIGRTGSPASRSARSTPRSSPAIRRSAASNALREFWETICSPASCRDAAQPDLADQPPVRHATTRAGSPRLRGDAHPRRRAARLLHAALSAALAPAARAARARPASTTPRRCAARWSGWSISTASTHGGCASRVGAVDVATGNFDVFRQRATCGCGPSTSWPPARCRPAFPPIEIDGEHYWDGGLVSNTPLATCSTPTASRHARASRSISGAPRAAADDTSRRARAPEGHPVFEPHARDHRRRGAPAEAAPLDRPAAGASCPPSSPPTTPRGPRAHSPAARSFNVIHLIYHDKA